MAAAVAIAAVVAGNLDCCCGCYCIAPVFALVAGMDKGARSNWDPALLAAVEAASHMTASAAAVVVVANVG